MAFKRVDNCFCNFRYITANTDTEEQSFPVHTALNTHTEELKLDILLQKADHLRMTESGKMESFELLCDHKEKVRGPDNSLGMHLIYYPIYIMTIQMAS